MITNKDALLISIGGIKVMIHAGSDFINELIKFYSNFIIEEGDPSIIIEVHVVPVTEFGKVDSDSPDVVIDEESDICTVIWQTLYGEYDIKGKKGILKCNHPIGLSNFIRIIFSLVLLEQPGFLVHASSLIKNGKGYLFPGKSGAGKTTITRLSPEATLLTDEVSLVKMVDGKFNLFGTPFWGELAIGGENVSVPLEAIYFPIKDDKHHINPLSDSQALQNLLPNVLFFLESSSHQLNLFNICSELITITPTYELHFLPEPSFWRLIDVE